MKKLIAAALTGALVLGTVGTSVVFAADDDKTITVAASETPHSEILEAAKPILEEEGYDLEVTVFDDYVQPNEVVESGEASANARATARWKPWRLSTPPCAVRSMAWT